MTIRHSSANLDGHEFLIVGNNGGGITRTLLQFEDLDSDCGTVESAKLKVYYEHAQGSVNPARTLKVHEVCNALQAYIHFLIS